MSVPIVFDSAGLDEICSGHPSPKVRGLLGRNRQSGLPVAIPTIVCGELCRGRDRTRRVEAALARQWPHRAAFRLHDTDIALAKIVGTILHDSGASSCDIVDAHVIAVSVRLGGGIVVTSDPNDINRLAQSVPGVHITTMTP